ncbi:hypothetical protein [Cupriavidus sp. CuC1]|uniref:hypothetical protein n=1 Tax=Cupriavidus sp. CuC1 TaxID=3373131 RepID=UPI0037D2CA7C
MRFEQLSHLAVVRLSTPARQQTHDGAIGSPALDDPFGMSRREIKARPANQFLRGEGEARSLRTWLELGSEGFAGIHIGKAWMGLIDQIERSRPCERLCTDDGQGIYRWRLMLRR